MVMNELALLAQAAGQQGGGGGALLVGGMVLVIFVLGLLSVVLWIWALIDAIRNPTLSDNERIIWVVVILLTQLLGAIIYLIIGRKGSATKRMT
jgi:hypothetical protein